MRAEAAALALVVVVSTGCSFGMMERLGGGYRREATPHCSTNPSPAVVDGLFAGIYAAATIESATDDRQQHASDAATGTGMAAVMAAGSVYGWWQWTRCRRAFADHDAYLERGGRPAAPVGAHAPGEKEPAGTSPAGSASY